MKIIYNIRVFSLIPFISSVLLLGSCTLKLSDKGVTPYHLEGELVTASHFGEFLSGFEYDACGIIVLDGKNPVIKQYEWDWNNDGSPDQLTYPPDGCRVLHKYEDKDVGIVTPSVKVVVTDEGTSKSYSAQTAKDDEGGDNVFYTWNYGTWEIKNAVINDTDCNNVQAGGTCHVTFSARYEDNNGDIQQLKFAPICIVPTGMNTGVTAGQTITPTLGATVAEFQAMLNSSVSPQVRDLIIEDLAENGIVLDGNSASGGDFLQFSSSGNCDGVQFVTNSEGLIGFDFHVKTKFLETAAERECLYSMATLDECDPQNEQTVYYRSSSSVNDYEVNRLYTIDHAAPASWMVFQFESDGHNYDADSIAETSLKSYDVAVFDGFGNPVNGNTGLNVTLSDPISQAVLVDDVLWEKESYEAAGISLYGFQVDYVSPTARTLQLVLSGSGVNVSENVSVTHGAGFEVVCESGCSQVTGIVKTRGSGVASVKVLDKYANVVSGEEEGKPVVNWQIVNADNAPVFNTGVNEMSVVTGSNGFNVLNLNNITFGIRRGDYELVARLGSTQQSFPLKVLPGVPSGISFKAYTDNSGTPVSGLDYLKNSNEANGVPFVFKKTNYGSLSGTYGKAVKIYVVDDEQNLIEKDELSLSGQSVAVMPDSMIDNDGNIEHGCTTGNTCQVFLDRESDYSANETQGESFTIGGVLDYDSTVGSVNFLASMTVDGQNYTVVSDPVEARMGYGYVISSPAYTFDLSGSGGWNNAAQESGNYVYHLDRDALVRFQICPADLTLDPRDSSLNIDTVIELEGEATNIFNENVLNGLGASFDAMGPGLTNCVNADLTYTYPENSSVLNEGLNIRARDDDETISTNFPFIVNSLTRAGMTVTPMSLSMSQVEYGQEECFAETVKFNKTGEQSLSASGILLQVAGDNSACFSICDTSGNNCTSSKTLTGNSGEYTIKFTSGPCILPITQTREASAELVISAQSASGETGNLTRTVDLTATRIGAPDVQIAFDGFNGQVYKVTEGYDPNGQTANVTVSNQGASNAYNVTASMSADTGMFLFQNIDCNNRTLTPGDSCSARITILRGGTYYRGMVGPSFSGTISAGGKSATFGFTAYYPSVQLSGNSINWGTLDYDQTASSSAAVNVTGNVPVTFSGMSLSSGSSNYVSMSCGTVPRTISVGYGNGCTFSARQSGTSAYSVSNVYAASVSVNTSTYGTLLFEYGDQVTVSYQRLAQPVAPEFLSIGEIVNVNGTIFFTAETAAHGIELWKTNGTEATTVLVKDLISGSGSSEPIYLTNVNGILFFNAKGSTSGSGNRELYRSDGTDAGTYRVRDIWSGANGSSPDLLTPVGSLVFFRTFDSSGYPRELRVSDGTEGGTIHLRDFRSATSVFNLFNFNGTLYFSAEETSGRRELWKSDGTVAGTVKVVPGNTSFYCNGPFGALGSYMYVGCNDMSSSTYGYEFYRTNGTEAGTTLHRDIQSGSNSGFNPTSYTNPNMHLVGSTLYFVGYESSANGPELWRTNGTTAQNVGKDIYTGNYFPFDGADPYAEINNFTHLGSTLYFTAKTNGDGFEVWKSDGTAAGTVSVSNVTSAEGNEVGNLTPMGSYVYFSAGSSSGNVELYRTNGTSSSLVKDIRTGSSSSSPNNLVTDGTYLYFAATIDDGREVIFRSSGTSATTNPIVP